MARYQCYFITAADKAGACLPIDAATPEDAAALARHRARPDFVAVEIWQGSTRVLVRKIQPIAAAHPLDGQSFEKREAGPAESPGL